MKQKSTGELIGGMVAAIVMIALVNSVLLWRHLTHGVVLESWVDILWAANLSLVLQVAGNLLLAFFRPPRLYSFLQAVFAAAGLVSVIVFYIVYPLDFSRIVGDWLDSAVRIALIVGMAGSAIAVVVHLVRFALGRPYQAA